MFATILPFMQFKPAGPQGDSLRRTRLLFALRFSTLCCVLALGSLHCAPEDSTGPPLQASTETPAPSDLLISPPDLDQLDRAVRDQFLEVTAQVEGSSGDPREQGLAWGRLGQWYQIYRYPESAARCYLKAQEAPGRDPRWPYFLGTMAEERGDLEAAEEAFRRAEELAPQATAPLVRLGDLALRRQDLEQAEALYHRALKLAPEEDGALLGLGRLWLQKGDGRRSLDFLEPLHDRQPEAAEANYTLALVWRQLGAEDRAKVFLDRVPAQNLDQIPLTSPNPWERELQAMDLGARTLTRRGVRAFRRGDPFAAAMLLGQAVTADPEGAEQRINYGIALQRLGLDQAALEQLQEALRRAPEGSEMKTKAHLELGRFFLGGRGFPRARHHLLTALALDDRSAAVHLEVARLAHLTGDVAQALAHYRDAEALGADGPEVRFWHAALLEILKRPEEAFAHLEASDPTAAGRDNAFLLQARIVSTPPPWGLERPEEAQALLARASPQRTVLYAETAAMVAAASADFETAIAWQGAAVEALAGGPKEARHRAQRRLALYREGKVVLNPWEIREKVLGLTVNLP